MTTAPARPLVHAYSGEDPYEIIDSAWGSIERWRADALATGELSGITELAKQVRNDAVSLSARLDARQAELDARADAIAARELTHAVSVTNFVDFVGKASVLFDRLEHLRADAEEGPLPSPPGEPSDPSKDPEPSLELEDEVQPAHGDPPGDPPAEFPTGEQPGPPVVAQPIAAGLDDIEEEEEKHG